MRRQRTVGKGGINWSVECSAVREANERRKRAEQRDSCGAIRGSSIEHRTSLIFSLNLAQRIERGNSNPSNRTSSTGPAEATANVYTFNGTPDWDLSQSDTPNHLDHPRPLTVLTGVLLSGPYTNIRPTTCDTAHEVIKPVFCGNFA
jgi:hypothetical protein